MKNIAFFLLFFLLVSGHSNANAVGGSIGGWNVVSNVASGIGAKITATKEVMVNGASKVVTGTANITPKFTDVGQSDGRSLENCAARISRSKSGAGGDKVSNRLPRRFAKCGIRYLDRRYFDGGQGDWRNGNFDFYRGYDRFAANDGF